MPNIGPLEIAIVLIIALVVFGPKRLPELGRSLGRGIREFQGSVSGDNDDDDEPEPQARSSPPQPPPPRASRPRREADERRPRPQLRPGDGPPGQGGLP